MENKITPVLMAVLLGLIGFYIFQSDQIQALFEPDVIPEPPLDGKNDIQLITIQKDDPGNAIFLGLDVKYRFIGDLAMGGIRAYSIPTKQSPMPIKLNSSSYVKRGEHVTSVILHRDQDIPTAYTTRFIRVELFDRSSHQVVASKDIEYPIEWGRLGEAMERGDHKKKDVETLYQEAVAEINFGTRKSLGMAKTLLDIIISKSPRYVPVYPEFARYYLKFVGGTEGARLAEQSLKRGLEINPKHADSHVLLGYVYTNNDQYRLAEASFAKAVDMGTDNPWLWVNWGQLYIAQGKLDDAADMLQKVIDRGRSYDRYAQARLSAYYFLKNVYLATGDIDKTDELYLRRLAEYPDRKCFSYRYAQFRQQHFNDADLVLKHTRIAQNFGCNPQTGISEITGIAYYSKWVDATELENRQSYLSLAQSFYPEGPKLFLDLSQNKKTLPILQKLLKEGANVDVDNNEGMTALAYAVGGGGSLDAAEYLILFGADPNKVVGKEKIPLLAKALFERNKEAAKLLIKHGADVNTHINSDTTILDIINQLGYADILNKIEKET